MIIYSKDRARLEAVELAVRKACDVERRELISGRTFESAGDFNVLFTKRFFRALHAAASCGDGAYQIVCLDPDPIQYFHAHFGIYPICEFRITDDPADILRGLGRDPGGSLADAISSRGDAVALISTDSSWLILATRDDDSLRVHFKSESAAATFLEHLERSDHK